MSWLKIVLLTVSRMVESALNIFKILITSSWVNYFCFLVVDLLCMVDIISRHQAATGVTLQ